MGMAGGARDPPPEAVGGAPSHAHRQPSSGGGVRRRPEGTSEAAASRGGDIGVGLAENRDLVCFGIFEFWRSGEVRWIAVRSVILLIGGPFFGFDQNSISASSSLR